MSKQVFTANQILTAAQMNTLQQNDYNETVSTKTASYTLVAADAGTQVAMNSASSTTITVNTSLFTAGDSLTISNIGSGVTTVTAGTATVSSAGPLAVPQYGGGRLVFSSTSAAIFFPSAVTASAGALTFIASTALTGASITVSNCFSATYNSYLITITDMNANSTVEARFRLGSGTNHYYNRLYSTPGNAETVSASGTNGTGFNFVSIDTVCNANIYVGAPFLVAQTQFESDASNFSSVAQFMNCKGIETSTTQFTSFTINPVAASFTTGTVKVFGLANS